MALQTRKEGTREKEFADWLINNAVNIVRNDKNLTSEEIANLSLKEECEIVLHNGNIIPTSISGGKAFLDDPSNPLYSIEYKDELKAYDLLIGLHYGI